MDRSRRNTSDKSNASEKLEHSARSRVFDPAKNNANPGDLRKREALPKGDINSQRENIAKHPNKYVVVQNPENVQVLGIRAEKSKIANPGELQKREALPKGDINSQGRNLANRERFIPGMRPDVSQKEYDQHKHDIHEKLSKLEESYKFLKREDQRLEKRFNNLSWFKRLTGIDSKKKIDKCESQLKESRNKLHDAIHYLENMIRGNPNFYTAVSLKDMIRFSNQDEKKFQERIDRIKLRKPQHGDKLTPRQKRFEEQEFKRIQVIQEENIKNREVYRKEQNKKIDKFKEDVGKMLKESKEYMNRAARNKNAVKLFRAAELVSNRVSLWKMREKVQYKKIHNFPDLSDKCKNIREELNAYHKELNDTMKKKFGTQWTLRNVKSR